MSRHQRIIPISRSVDAAGPAAPAGAPGIAPATRIQARAVTGRYTRWRWALVLLTQAVFYGLPWCTWGGRQAVWFDLEGRRFHLFGSVLFPQDLVLLTGVLVFSALLLFAATALVGRVWCGFACPQTVYTSVFLWIEQRTEGDRLARLRLDAAPWRAPKLLRRGGKHLAWAGLALWTGFTLVGWFTPIRALAQAVPTFDLGPWELFWTLFYAAATYVHAGLLREKVCQHACPYGRFQGAMLDPATRVVAYDAARGEPRAPRPRGVQARPRGQGDCVDCTLCVQVCPVGIDIRHGLQAACISCGLCIDACNQVMDKVGSPRGLIRYATENGVAQGLSRQEMLRRVARPRVLIYGLVLLVVSVAFVASLTLRPPFHVDVFKDRNTLGREAEDGRIENVYRLAVLNTSDREQRFTAQAQGLPGLQARLRADLVVGAGERTDTTLTLALPPGVASDKRGHAQAIVIEVRRADGAMVATKASFFVPR